MPMRICVFTSLSSRPGSGASAIKPQRLEAVHTNTCGGLSPAGRRRQINAQPSTSEVVYDDPRLFWTACLHLKLFSAGVSFCPCLEYRAAVEPAQILAD